MVLRAREKAGRSQGVADEHWILGGFATSVLGTLVLGLPLQSLPGNPFFTRNSPLLSILHAVHLSFARKLSALLSLRAGLCLICAQCYSFCAQYSALMPTSTAGSGTMHCC